MAGYKMQVPFFDAASQYLFSKKEIDIAVQSVMAKGSYINGVEVREFSSKLASYLNINYVIPCGNGTDALYLALMSLGLEEGDEVIVPTFNFIAAAEVIALLGLKPIFVDANNADFNIDVSKIEKRITAKTKAIIAVHLFGAAADLEAILALAEKHQLFLIEDVAQALGSSLNSKKLGAFGHIGCTSFFPTKNLACCGDGGAVFTNDENIAKRLKMLANHGQSVKYEHQLIGINSRLDTIQATILNIQLNHLDSYINKRRAVAEVYRLGLSELDGVNLPQETKFSVHSYNQYCMLLASEVTRDNLKAYLKENGVATMVYYPKPLHLQEAFSNLGYKKGDFPVAENLCNRTLALPVSPALEKAQQNHVIGTIKNFFKSYAN
jgi:dTDP-4-amino-4,6-dideoxygalactose transaminase